MEYADIDMLNYSNPTKGCRFSKPSGMSEQTLQEGGLDMLTMTNPSVTREPVWEACRGAHKVRWRERYHGICLAFEGNSCAEIAPGLSRDEGPSRTWVPAVNHVGRQGLERAVLPGRPA